MFLPHKKYPLALLSLLFFLAPVAKSQVPVVSSFPPYTFDIKANPSIKRTLTNDQISAIAKLVKDHHDLELNCRSKMKELDQQIAAKFLNPEAKREEVFSIQDQIDKLQSQIDEDAVKTAAGIRNTLSTKQREILVYGDPEINFPGIELSSEQWDAYKKLMDAYFARTGQLLTKKAALEFDRRILYQAMSFDQDELLAKQNEINSVQSELENERVRLAFAARQILTPAQRSKAYNRHHPKIWEDTGINDRQDDIIMGIHNKIESADQTGRRKLITLESELAQLYRSSSTSEDAALAKIKEIDAALAETYRAQLGFMFDGRGVLTPQQRKRLTSLMKVPYEPTPNSQLVPPSKNPTLLGPNGVSDFATDFAEARYINGSNVLVREPNIILVNSGKILVSTYDKNAVIKSGSYKVDLAAGALVLLTKTRNTLSLINLYDSKSGSVKVSSGNKTYDLGPGTELILADSEQALRLIAVAEKIGRRAPAIFRWGKQYSLHADVSIGSVLSNDELFKRLVARHNNDDKKIVDRTMEMAAILMQATARKGQYTQAK